MKKLEFMKKFIQILLISCIFIFANGFKVEKNPRNYLINYAVKDWQELNTLSEYLPSFEINENFPEKDWWANFCDPVLDNYINQALASNKDVRTALARIEEMEGYTQSAFSNELPKLDLNTYYFRFLNSSENFLFANPQNSIKNVLLIPLIAQYEVDIFRKNHPGTLSARKQAEASSLDYKTAQIMVSSSVANDYFNLILTDKIIKLQCELMKYQEELLKQQNCLFKEGVASYDDVLTAQQNISATKTSIEEKIKLRGIYVHRLCVLVGVPPVEQSGFTRSDIDCINFPSLLNAGSPSDLIIRRPDIMSSEKNLESAGIDISFARRQFLPSLNATGLFNYSSFQPGNIFDWSSNASLVGGSLKLPIYEGKMFANLKIKKAVYKQAIEGYQKSVLTALQEVEDSFISLNSDIKQFNQAEEDAVNAEKKLGLTENRYNEGIASCLDVLLSKQDYIKYKQSEVNIKVQVLVDNISLYKALGGGF